MEKKKKTGLKPITCNGYAVVAPIDLVRLGTLIDIGKGDMSVEALANKAGVAFSIISSIFSGERKSHVNFDSLKRIYDAFENQDAFTFEQFCAANGMLIGDRYQTALSILNDVRTEVDSLQAVTYRAYAKKKCWKKGNSKITPIGDIYRITNSNEKAIREKIASECSYDRFICALSTFAMPYAESNHSELTNLCKNTKKIYDNKELRTLIYLYDEECKREKEEKLLANKQTCLTRKEYSVVITSEDYRKKIEAMLLTI